MASSLLSDKNDEGKADNGVLKERSPDGPGRTGGRKTLLRSM